MKPFFLKVFLLSVFCIHSLHAAEKKFSWNFEAGAFASEVEKYLSTSGVYQSESSTIGPFFRVRSTIRLGKWLDFDPAIGFLVPWRSENDGAQKSIPIHLNLDAGIRFTSWLKMRLGAGSYNTLYFGGGDAVVLNNGNSTATYYTGDELVLSTNFTFQAGLMLFPNSRFNVNLDAYAVNVLSSTRRSFNVTATLGLHL